MDQLTVGPAGFPPSIRPGRAFRGGCGMVGYGYGGLGSRPRSGRGQAFRGDDGLGVRTSFEIVSKWLWAAVSVSLLMQIVIIYTPKGSTAFGTVPLGPQQWGILPAGLVVGFAAAIVTGRLVVQRFGPL